MSADFRSGPERSVFKGHVFEVVVAEFVAPDGETIERDLVRHPGAVAAVPIVGDEVILVRQFRAALGRDLLEIPAGLRDVAGEAPERTAARELGEEIGMRAGRLEPLGGFFNSAGFSDEYIHLFLATELEAVPRQVQGVEEQYMSIERVRLDDVMTLIGSGELCDAKSIVGLTLTLRKFGR